MVTMTANIRITIQRTCDELRRRESDSSWCSFRPSDVSMKQSRSSLHDSMGDFNDDKRRTYLVKYGDGDDLNDDQPNFSTAV